MKTKIPIAFGCALGVLTSEVVRHGVVHINWLEAGIAVVIAIVVVLLIPTRFFEKLKR